MTTIKSDLYSLEAPGLWNWLPRVAYWPGKPAGRLHEMKSKNLNRARPKRFSHGWAHEDEGISG